MSGDVKTGSFSENLMLDNTEEGVVIKGIKDHNIAKKSGLKEGDEIVAATVHLDHLDKKDVLKILKVLEPYDDNMKVVTKQELNASAGLGSLGANLRGPAEMLKKDFSLDTSAESSLDGLNGKLNAAQGLGGEISGHTLNGDLPSLTLNEPLADGGAKLKASTLGMTVPNIKGADIDGTLNAPDISIPSPQLNTPSASLDISKPEVKTGALKYKAPQFKMPQFTLPELEVPKGETNVSGDLAVPAIGGSLDMPDLNLQPPKLDIKNPDMDLNGPKVDLNCPDGNLEIPNVGKFRWPHQKWKGLKVKGPDANLNADLSAPDVNLSAPKIDANVSTPDAAINMPTADLKSPSVDLNTPDIDFDAPAGKIKGSHWKWKKPRFDGPKADVDLKADLNTPDADLSVPKVEGGVKAPNFDLNLPKSDLEGPNLDVQTPHVDIDAPSGKFNWPHKKWKLPKLNGPKADAALNADLNTPDVDLSVPKFEADINAPNAALNLPKADLKGPDIDVKTPDLDVDAPSSKIHWPQWKWKKPRLHGPKADMDINTDVSTPGVDLSLPNIDGEMNKPDVDLNLPKGDAGIEAPSGKVRLPTLQKPKFHLPGAKVKTPDVDLNTDVKSPDLSLSPPEFGTSLHGSDVGLDLPSAHVDKPELNLKSPNVDTGSPSGKFKWPTFKKRKLTGPKLKGPDVDLDADISAPDLNLSAPKIDGEVNAPDVNLNLPKTDLEDPKLDINAPDIEGPHGKFKWFSLKKPKFGTLRGPKADVDADVNVPDLDLKCPDVDLTAADLSLSASAPKVEGGIDAPDMDIVLPKADLKAPNVDLLDTDVDASAGKFKFPKMKLPKFGFGGTKMRGPDLDTDINPDVDVSILNVDAKPPTADLNLPNVDVNTPDLNLPSPKLKGDVAAPDLNLSLPKTDLKAPDLSLSAPTLKGGIDAPNLDIDLPKADLKNPNVDLPDPDVDVSGGKFKFPKIKLPKFDFGEAKMKGPDLAVDTDINPDLDVSGCFASPNVDAQLPTADLKLPNVDVNTPDLNLPSPKFKGPEVVVPDLNLSLPKADLKSPDLSLSAPKPEAGLVTKNLDINLPKANFKGLQAPDAQLKTPHLDDPLGDFRMPHFKVPKLGLSSPEANVGTLTTDANISVPSVDGEISSPNVSVPAANTSLNKPDLSITAEGDANVKNSPKSKLRWPFKWGLTSSSNDEDGNGVDSESDVPSPNLEVPTFKLHKLPRSNFDEIGGLVDGIGIPKTDTQAKDYMISKGVRLPIVNAASNIGEKVDIMERLKLAKEKPTANISPTEAKTDVDLKGGIAAPSLDVSASSEPGDSSLLRGGTFKVVKPEPGLGLEIPTVSSSDENDKLSLSLSNMLGLNVKDQNTD